MEHVQRLIPMDTSVTEERGCVGYLGTGRGSDGFIVCRQLHKMWDDVCLLLAVDGWDCGAAGIER